MTKNVLLPIEFDPYNLGRPNFYFQTIKLCYEISNFAHIQVNFNTSDCLVENTDV